MRVEIPGLEFVQVNRLFNVYVRALVVEQTVVALPSQVVSLGAPSAVLEHRGQSHDGMEVKGPSDLAQGEVYVAFIEHIVDVGALFERHE